MARRLDWDVDGRDWPLREASRFVRDGDLRWHVQLIGSGPIVLLLHGTGASTHSWRELAPRLAHRHTVVMPDLPGHGFSSRGSARQMTLPGMAQAVHGLLRALAPVIDAPPGGRLQAAIGHSAGAAVAARLALDGRIDTPVLIALNGAFLPWGGPVGRLFSPLAKLLASAGWVPGLFARRATDPAVVRRLVEGTGSRLDEAGLAFYRRLVSSPAHAEAALAMMANWELQPLWDALPGLRPALHLVVGEADRAVPPSQARRLCARVPGATLHPLPGLGYLARRTPGASPA